MLEPIWFDHWFEERFPAGREYGPLEVAEALGVNKNVVYRALACGELDGIRTGRKWIIPRQAIRDWLLERVAPNIETEL